MTQPIPNDKYERDTLLMLILEGDEFGDDAFDRAVKKLQTMNDAKTACEAVIRWERSSLEHEKPRDSQLLVEALTACHQVVGGGLNDEKRLPSA